MAPTQVVQQSGNLLFQYFFMTYLCENITLLKNRSIENNTSFRPMHCFTRNLKVKTKLWWIKLKNSTINEIQMTR